MEISEMLSAATRLEDIPELLALRSEDPSLFKQLHCMQGMHSYTREVWRVYVLL